MESIHWERLKLKHDKSMAMIRDFGYGFDITTCLYKIILLIMDYVIRKLIKGFIDGLKNIFDIIFGVSPEVLGIWSNTQYYLALNFYKRFKDLNDHQDNI